MKTRRRAMVALVPVLALLALVSFGLWSCGDAGDDAGDPTGPNERRIDQDGSKPGISISVHGDPQPGGTFKLDVAYRNPEGSLQEGVPILCGTERLAQIRVGNETFDIFQFLSNPTFTSEYGSASVLVAVSPYAPSPESYMFVCYTSPAFNGPTARAYQLVVVSGAGAETISTPAAPTGNATVSDGQTADYFATGAVSNLGHAVEYQFLWGDGSQSAWIPNGRDSHTWTVSGACPKSSDTFEVRVIARCQTHTVRESQPSSALAVTATRTCP